LRFQVGDGTTTFVNVTNAEGQLLVSRRGVAGSLRVNASSFALPSGIALSSSSIGIELNTIPTAITETFQIAGQARLLSPPAGPIQAGAGILLRINTTGAAVDETIQLAGRTVAIRFGAAESAVVGGVFEISFSGLSLNIADFVTLEGNITFATRTLSDGVTTADVFAGEALEAFLGRGPPKLASGDPNPLAQGVLLSNARIGLIRVGTTYALAADGTVTLVGIEG